MLNTKKIDATIKVGNLGTKPILKYSTTTGIPKINANIKKSKANNPKK